MMEGNQKWLWIGAGVLVVYFLFLRRSSGGAQIIPAPDTSGTDAARFNFASQGLGALAGLADKISGYNAEAAIASINANAAVNAEGLRDSALVAQSQSSANASTAQANSRENTSIWDTAIMAGAGLFGAWLNGRNAPAPRSSGGGGGGGGGMAWQNPYTGPGAFDHPIPISAFTPHFG